MKMPSEPGSACNEMAYFAVEKRTALEAWGKHVQALAEGRAANGNVIALRT